MSASRTEAVARVQHEFDVSEELQHREDGLEWRWRGQGQGGAGSGQECEATGPREILVYGGASLQNAPVLLST